MDVQRLAAFADAGAGGNPAGVWIGDTLPEASRMQRIAAKVGFSETAFAAPLDGHWRVRYFAPELEVPFCGHATIALGAALAMRDGDGVFELELNDTTITVEGRREGASYSAALQSPGTWSRTETPAIVAEACALFGYAERDLDPRIPPATAHAGASHLVLAPRERQRLAAMSYELEAGRRFMLEHGWITVSLVHAGSDRRFHVRNPFAAGGVYEDPATGAAAAALAGYLRDVDWPHQGSPSIVQGEDMGMRSRIEVTLGPAAGSSVRVSGAVRTLT